MKIYNDIEQGTAEWFAIRDMMMTASNACAIGSNGKGLETYAKELVMEHNLLVRTEWSNHHTDRGNELEPEARTKYTLETEQYVQEVGFVTNDDISDMAGCSPDGLVGDDGLMEIKCPSDKIFFQYILDGKIKSEYMWQMQMQMLITERKWCDYVVYNPNFKKDIIIVRVDRDDTKFKKLKEGLKSGKKLIQKFDKEFNQSIKKK